MCRFSGGSGGRCRRRDGLRVRRVGRLHVYQRLRAEGGLDGTVGRVGRRPLGHVDAAAIVANRHAAADDAHAQPVVDIGGVLGAADADGAGGRVDLVMVRAGLADAAADGAKLAAEQAHEAALVVAGWACQVIVVQAQHRALPERHHGAVHHAQLHAALASLHRLTGLDALPGLQLAHHPLGRHGPHIATGEQHRGRRCRPGQAAHDTQRGQRHGVAKTNDWRGGAAAVVSARRAAHGKLLWAVIWKMVRA